MTVGEVLKSKKDSVQVYAVEPETSPVLSGGQKGAHPIQGIGAGFVPKVLNTDIYDAIIQAPSDAAFETARAVANQEGILVGISAGAALAAAVEVAKREENEGKNIVIIFPDGGDHYLSTPELF